MHRRIIGDTLNIGVLTAATKAAGAAKIIVAAHYFGASDQLDAYLMAFLIPAFVSDVLSGGITQSFLPVLVEVRSDGGRERAHALYSSVLLAGAGLLAIAAAVIAVFSGFALSLVAAGFTPEKLELTRRLLWIMLPILPVSALNVLWRTLLNADERFAVAALAPVLTPLTSIAFLLTLGTSYDIYALAAGTLVGAFLEIAVLGAAVKALGTSLLPRWRGFSADARRVLAQYVPVASANLIMGGSSVVDQMMAATLVSGSVSILNYGTRLVGVVLAIGPAALGTAVLPRFSLLAAARDWSQLRKVVRTFTLLSIGITIPATGILCFYSEPLVRLFFQRGAFTQFDTRAVAIVQTASLLQIPFSVLLVLLVRVLSSVKANVLLIDLAILSLAANTLLDLLLMRWYGVAGIALSTTAVHAIGVAYLLLFTFRRARRRGLIR